jgi:hypothetical protein
MRAFIGFGIFAVLLTAVIGYWMNIVHIFHAHGAMLIARVIGIAIPVVGAVLGWVS